MNTETAILEAALEEFVLKGFDAATTREIAEKAGVNEVTLFRKFNSKKKLFFRVIQYHRESAFKPLINLFEVIDKKANLKENLTIFITEIMQIIEERSSFLMLLLLEGYRKEKFFKEIGIGQNELLARLMGLFQQKIKDQVIKKIDSFTASLVIVGFLLMCLLMVQSNNPNLIANKKNIMNSFVQIFCEGILKIKKE